ncbi:hypothetical protein OSH39_20535 [Mycobacterium ulcerans]|uniref:DUF559 domain-containing protein n=2 Tax=Mycobacterium ulcerans TaxID=1809 RepID=A0PWE4_MYCUA|nr:hypothetical protein [Mycobacterium ulcerans]ABL06663.1 conserved hypothetical protein [Mycobacterium ulcerans Agy99]MEB3906695.1 hypothetical protein [Mycobacterium ulcerans]MEB3910845.1 hypothetical protein [Mycobacterium ulcerans]MEB3921097.1 hypothetical protein [Mycobacterium ulcerans]MEB3925201.1 hypothetical protein [Mycobacterium ulcerans]
MDAREARAARSEDVFVGSGAVRRGRLSPYRLRTEFRAIYPDVYLPAHAAPSFRTRCKAAWLWTGRRGVLGGLAAAGLHGSDWIGDDEPVELIWRNPHPPAGVITRNQRIEPDEVTRVAGLAVTTLARTAFDLGRQLPGGESVARLDALMRATAFSGEDVLLLAKRYSGARGLRRLRATLPLVDAGAASPRESWLRMVLIDAGLPVPVTQIPVHQNWRLVAVLDMGWQKYQVAAEYDGDQHRFDRRQYAREQWRLRKLDELGWIVIRVIAGDAPEDVVRRVRQALARRGHRET